MIPPRKSRIAAIQDRLARTTPRPWHLPEVAPVAATGSKSDILVTPDDGVYVELSDLLDAVPDELLRGTAISTHHCGATNDAEVTCPKCDTKFTASVACGAETGLSIPYDHDLTDAVDNDTPSTVRLNCAADMPAPKFIHAGDRELVRWAHADMEFLLALVHNAARIFIGTVANTPVYVDRAARQWTVMVGADVHATFADLDTATDASMRIVREGNGVLLLPTRPPEDA